MKYNDLIKLQMEHGELTEKFNILTDEIDWQLKLVNINVIKDEDKNKLTDFIKTNFNEVLNRLKAYYKKNNTFVHYIEKFYI